MSESSAIDAALVATLITDAALAALMPDGVFFDEAKPGATKFVIVSLASESDQDQFGGTAYEDALYLVKAVALASSGADVKAAASRIHTLLHDKPLTATGYTCMTVHREDRVRFTEVDEIDPSIRWQHRGGHYRVQMSL